MENEKYNIALAKAQQWLNSNIDQHSKNEIERMINLPDELVDAFYENLEFGTGGLRGIMGVGTNRMNIYIVQMATQGLCNYLVKTFPQEPKKIAISYDSRNNSKLFAEATANVCASNGFEVFIFDDIRPTPELSFAVRKLGCISGVMITASHNPKEYNGYKAYGNDGGQYISPHDKNIINEVKAIKSIDEVKVNQNKENIKILDYHFDNLYFDEVLKLSINKEIIHNYNNLAFVYTPLHGTGIKLVPEALKRAGFTNVQIVEEQAIMDGNFPTVKSPNPEEKSALEMAINKAQKINADLVFATDPDADRVGIAVKDSKNNFVLLNGNQTASVLTYYILEQWSKQNKFKGNEYIIKTIVTTELLTKIAKKYQIEIFDVLTGFKYIAEIIRQNEGKKTYVCGGEESYGFLIGDYVRDKDAVSACLLIAEVAAWARSQNKTIWDILMDIYREFGLYKEALVSITKKGMNGQEEIKNMMKNFRSNPPKTLANSKIVIIKDYLEQKEINVLNHSTTAILLPKSDVLQFITEDETIISVRPSGTEPKIKFYIGTKATIKNNFDETDQLLTAKIEHIKSDLNI
ncbi:MAG: phospho-sugar mutase [Bacteroidales bacterium]|jgi:phosphoglucomutase|nr:phospho-sugar mutase [Bacteroidales bacterium]